MVWSEKNMGLHSQKIQLQWVWKNDERTMGKQDLFWTLSLGLAKTSLSHALVWFAQSTSIMIFWELMFLSVNTSLELSCHLADVLAVHVAIFALSSLQNVNVVTFIKTKLNWNLEYCFLWSGEYCRLTGKNLWGVLDQSKYTTTPSFKKMRHWTVKTKIHRLASSAQF